MKTGLWAICTGFVLLGLAGACLPERDKTESEAERFHYLTKESMAMSEDRKSFCLGRFIMTYDPRLTVLFQTPKENPFVFHKIAFDNKITSDKKYPKNLYMEN